MTTDEKFFASRLKELSGRSFNRGIWTYSEFLTMAEQSLVSASAESEFELVGGFDAAERRIAVFGSEDSCGYPFAAPIKVIKIEPVSKKFSDVLSHRDFLGSIMSLGIKREVLGDIVIRENIGYVVCLENIAEFLKDNILQIKHTTVHCEILDSMPDGALSEPAEKEVLVSSERVDAVVAAVYNLSRSDSKELFDQKKIYIDSKSVILPSAVLKEGSIVSVRGRGRFKYYGIVRQTKKGKMAISVAVY
ncbi:MAG: hypothetical protein IJ017_04750 [Oscillospiraceae bacterium]|nr:hypothetical protein [Oscillospiraceae bacterium]